MPGMHHPCTVLGMYHPCTVLGMLHPGEHAGYVTPGRACWVCTTRVCTSLYHPGMYQPIPPWVYQPHTLAGSPRWSTVHHCSAGVEEALGSGPRLI